MVTGGRRRESGHVEALNLVAVRSRSTPRPDIVALDLVFWCCWRGLSTTVTASRARPRARRRTVLTAGTVAFPLRRRLGQRSAAHGEVGGKAIEAASPEQVAGDRITQRRGAT